MITCIRKLPKVATSSLQSRRVTAPGGAMIHHRLSSVQQYSSTVPTRTATAASSPPITENQVREIFHLWNDALSTEDPDTVAQRYASQAVLLPTVSNTPRTDYDSIKDYFINFLKKKPKGEIVQSHVTIGNNWCSDMGVYEFTMGTTGEKVKGRYTFNYVWEDGQWKIAHHHSSVMPEQE